MIGSLEERYWAKVDVQGPDDCWPWTASRTAEGHGLFWVDRDQRFTTAHRTGWFLAYGDPGEMHVLHRCDNPPCQNLTHLWLGTNADNVADRVFKGRSNVPRGEANPRAKLTQADVDKIRRRYVFGQGAVLGREFGVGRSQIHAIVSGGKWLP